MSKYLFVYHGGSMPDSEEEQAKVMQAWGAWFGALGASIVDVGNPCGRNHTVASDGSASEDAEANPAKGYSLVTPQASRTHSTKPADAPFWRVGAASRSARRSKSRELRIAA